jgi:hypothetical protein
VFRALAAAAGLDAELEGALLLLLQGKDVPSLRELCAQLDEPLRSALLSLPALYGRRRNTCSGDEGLCPPGRRSRPPWRPCGSCRRRCPICRYRSTSLTCAVTIITTVSFLRLTVTDFCEHCCTWRAL